MNCKICNSTTLTVKDKQFRLDYFNCTNCDYLFLNPDDIVSKEEELRIYELHQNTLENTGYVNMFKDFIKKTITPHQSNIKTALDFGSGPEPVLAHLLTEEGFDVDIYDPFFSPNKIYENKTYDLITSTEVVEHLKNPLETFELLYNCLNPEGILSMLTLFHPQDDERFQTWWYRRDTTHISFYTHTTFKYLAEKFNMKIVFLDNKNTCAMQKLS